MEANKGFSKSESAEGEHDFERKGAPRTWGPNLSFEKLNTENKRLMSRFFPSVLGRGGFLLDSVRGEPWA